MIWRLSGANVDFKVRELVTSILGVRVASNPKKYLRLPMMVGRKKRWVLLILWIGLGKVWMDGACVIF